MGKTLQITFGHLATIEIHSADMRREIHKSTKKLLVMILLVIYRLESKLINLIKDIGRIRSITC
ncbi:MAG TPA: hypothetical protein PKV93_10455 [Fervidobacterium sp.]|nr:hypothetical protein [Fervidobacterium sp.]